MTQSTETPTLVRYLVTLNTPQGEGQIEVPSTLGAEAAGRRAVVSAASIRFGEGDLDTITVVDVTPIEDEG